MLNVPFNFTALFKAPRIALSFQRIWLQLIGFLSAYLIYTGFSYFALCINGFELKYAWKTFHLFPYLTGANVFGFSWIIYGVGIFIAMIILMFTATAVSRASYMLIKGHNFYTWREAFRFARKKMSSILMAPIAFGIIILCFFLGGWFVGLVGFIPMVGTIGFSLFSIIWIMLCLILLFFMVILCGVILLFPAIVATTDEDAFEVIFQIIAIIWHQPARVIFYHLGCLVQSVFTLGIFAFIMKRAILLFMVIYQTPWLVAKSFREDFANLMNQAFAHLQEWLFILSFHLDYLLGEFSPTIKAQTYLAHFFPLIKKPLIKPEIDIAAYIVAVSLLFIGGIVLSYAFATFNTGMTISYLVLRYKKDNENLLDRRDDEEKMNEELEEEAPPPPAPEEKNDK